MFGERLKELRRERAWSLKELARRAGITEAQLVRLEHGRAEPRPSTVQKLADAFGVEPRALVGPSTGGSEGSVTQLESFDSTDGLAAFQVDRIVDRLVSDAVGILQASGPGRAQQIEQLAARLAAVGGPRIVTARARALSGCLVGVARAGRGEAPPIQPARASEMARELVAAALDPDLDQSEFERRFALSAQAYGGWFVAAPEYYRAAVQAYLLERTELEFAALDRRTPPFESSERQQLVSALGAVAASFLVALPEGRSEAQPSAPPVLAGV